MEKKGVYASLRPIPSLKKCKSMRKKKKWDQILTDIGPDTPVVLVYSVLLCVRMDPSHEGSGQMSV